MTAGDLPAVNASLNALSALLITAGYVAIRRRLVLVHRSCMLAAVSTSVLFLVSYLVYHAQVGSVPYRGAGLGRTIYFGVLLTHTILAVVVVPLVALTVSRALRSRFEAHVRVARWTLPIWLYVSVTGVVVYLMLYRFGGAS